MILNYKVTGKGKNIVLLHGWAKTASLESMKKLQTELAEKGYKVWAIDLPGFGKSPDAPTDWGVAQYAKEITLFIKKNLKNKPYYLLGHSFGGSLSAFITANLEPKPEKIILCSSSGLRYRTLKAWLALPIAKVFKLILAILPYPLKKKVRKLIYYKILKERDYVDSEDKKEQYLRVTREDLKETFKNIHKPTLIIWGKDDKVTPLKMGTTIHRLVKDSKIKVIKGRHGIIITNFKEIANLTNKFLKD